MSKVNSNNVPKSDNKSKITTVNIEIEYHINQTMVTFNVDKNILTNMLHAYSRKVNLHNHFFETFMVDKNILYKGLRIGEQDQYGSLFYSTTKIFDSLYEVDGVYAIDLQPYSIAIQIYMIYTWDKIIPEVVTRIKQITGCDAEVTYKEPYDKK